MYTHIYSWEHACMHAHTTYIQKKSSKVNKMVWQVKLFVAKLDHLNWNPWSHMTEGENQPYKPSSDPQMHSMVHTCHQPTQIK